MVFELRILINVHPGVVTSNVLEAFRLQNTIHSQDVLRQPQHLHPLPVSTRKDTWHFQARAKRATGQVVPHGLLFLAVSLCFSTSRV